MVFRYKRTEEDVKKQLWFSAFRVAGTFAEALLCMLLLAVFLKFLGALPLRITWLRIGMGLVVCLLAEAALTVFLAFRLIQNMPDAFLREAAYVCRMDLCSVRFENETSGSCEVVSYRDIRKVFLWQRNLFFEAEAGKRSVFFIIPASAFSSAAECREAGKRLKASVKEYQSREAKTSLFGSFAKGLAQGYGSYVKSCLILLLVIALFLLLFVLAGYIMKAMK